MTTPPTPPVTVSDELGDDSVAAVDREQRVAEEAEPYWSAWTMTEEEDMGQSMEQYECIRTLLGAMTQWVREQGWDETMYVGADQFFKWIEGQEHRVMVSPDLYILQPHPPTPRPTSIKTWLPGHNPPLLAVEVVSQDWRKDYAINPGRYADLGVRELVVFDPDAARTVGLPGAEGERTRVALQVYRSTPDDPTLVSVERGEGPAYCEVLQAWWVVTATDHGPRLRLARDGSPDQLVPLPTEALDRAERMLDEALDVRAQLAQQLDQERRAREHAQRQNRAIEQQRQEAEQRRQEAEQQRQEAERRSQADKQARQELERELDQLRALLAKHKHSEGS